LDWIIERKLGNKEFMVTFKLSLNRAKDVCLYCVCGISNSMEVFFEDGFPVPSIFIVKHAIPGIFSDLPEEGNGLDNFLLHFCDMEATI